MRVGLICEQKAAEIQEDQAISVLRDAGHDVVRIGDGAGLIARLEHWRAACDIVLILSVGYRGVNHDAFVPSVLERANIPYAGSQPHAQVSSRHKVQAKLSVAMANVQTPPAVLWQGPGEDAALYRLMYPVIVKPLAESSSNGIHAPDSVAETPRAAAVRARWVVSTFAQPALVEQFIRGTDVEVPLLGWPQLEALGVVGVTIDDTLVTGDAYLTAELVRTAHHDFTVSPRGLDDAAIKVAALRAAHALGMRDYGQIDFRIADDGTPYFIDATATPNLTRKSSFHAQALARGRTYAQMLDEVLTVAMRRANAA